MELPLSLTRSGGSGGGVCDGDLSGAGSGALPDGDRGLPVGLNVASGAVSTLETSGMESSGTVTRTLSRRRRLVAGSVTCSGDPLALVLDRSTNVVTGVS